MRLNLSDPPCLNNPTAHEHMKTYVIMLAIRDVRRWPKMDQICPTLDKSWTFSDQISVHFCSQSQNVLKSDLKKVPDLFHLVPIWPKIGVIRTSMRSGLVIAQQNGGLGGGRCLCPDSALWRVIEPGGTWGLAIVLRVVCVYLNVYCVCIRIFYLFIVCLLMLRRHFAVFNLFN